jgi:hypothetical protein
MWVIETKENYIETKQYLHEMIVLVRKRRKTMPKREADFFNSGFIQQIKEFIQQLRLYRRKRRLIV